MRLNVSEWEKQFERQSGWTRGIREHLYRKITIGKIVDALDVGCGSGVITKEVREKIRGEVIGLDKNEEMVLNAALNDRSSKFMVGDSCFLPFSDNSFDLVFFHFFLLWIREPVNALNEMKRVTKKDGFILALSEPDFGGKIDFPVEINLKEAICKSLLKDGADPLVGRKLKYYFHNAGLRTEVGVSTYIWDEKEIMREGNDEWRFLEKVLEDVISIEEINKYKTLEKENIRERVSLLPVFYAVGKKQ